MTQKTIKLSDIYVKKSDIPKKTSDLINDGNNGSSPFATLDNIPIIPTANATASNITMNGTRSAGSLDTYAKADHVHPTDTSRAALDHKHGSWSLKREHGSTDTALHMALYVNDDIDMAYFRFVYSVNSVQTFKMYGATDYGISWKNSTLNTQWIPVEYRPKFRAAGTITGGNLFVTYEGKIMAYFWIDYNGPLDLYGSVLWGF
jgi:hypothetical protein